jgi:hypothetical protein
MNVLEEIIEIVNELNNVDVTSSSRKEPHPMARMVYAAFAYRVTSFGWKEIMSEIGLKTSSMDYYLKKYQELYNFDSKYTKMYDELSRACRSIIERQIETLSKIGAEKTPTQEYLDILDNTLKQFHNREISKTACIKYSRKIIGILKEIENGHIKK